MANKSRTEQPCASKFYNHTDRIFVFVDHYPATSLSAFKINKTFH